MQQSITLTWQTVAALVVIVGAIQAIAVTFVKMYVKNVLTDQERNIISSIENKYISKEIFEEKFESLVHRFNNISARQNLLAYTHLKAITAIEIKVGMLPSNFVIDLESPISEDRKGKTF